MCGFARLPRSQGCTGAQPDNKGRPLIMSKTMMSRRGMAPMSRAGFAGAFEMGIMASLIKQT